MAVPKNVVAVMSQHGRIKREGSDMSKRVASCQYPVTSSSQRTRPTGYWLLATGYWLLATGYWILAL